MPRLVDRAGWGVESLLRSDDHDEPTGQNVINESALLESKTLRDSVLNGTDVLDIKRDRASR
ncbi:hypothetical protein AB0E10_18195 [Streptomyces sp. NPDC048045]|uniref:hypothetical protein n=1 Tax=Streptomyces sp. NPDC048045 TaxID=3154710 RepID=UPI00343E75CC